MKKRKNTILLVIAIITLITVVLGATYAYFQAQGTGGANIDTNIITGTTDLLSFKFGDEINIQANEENFAEGMPSLSDSTTGSAILRANDATNSATATYNIYLIIESNDFEYTTEEGTPELLLNVTDPNGNKVENITGLVHYEDGFDITTRTGGFLLIPDYEITATNVETIQDWLIEVTFVNLDSDQNANTGKTLTGKLYITQDQMSSYELAEINNIDTTVTSSSIDATLDITNGSAAVEKYYYGIEEATGTRSAETVEYVESDSANYEFANLKSNTEYTIYSYVVDENDIKSNVYSTNVTTSEYENPTIDNVTHSVTLNSITVNVTASGGTNNISKYYYSKDDGATWEESASNTYIFSGLTAGTTYNFKVYVTDTAGHSSSQKSVSATTEKLILLADYIKKEVYQGDGINGLYYHDGSGTYTNADNEAGDNSYRYSGANPNNYVCFGTDSTFCPVSNLYRIIGVFGDQVKLIKNINIGDDYWGDLSSLSWDLSTLNTEILNGTYLKELESTWASKIATTTWQVGGNTYLNIMSASAKIAYLSEIVDSEIPTTYNAKIGLMYVSDYGYATDPSNWNTDLRVYNITTIRNSNWLYTGVSDWTITRDLDRGSYAFNVSDEGNVDRSNAANTYGVRPVFYLNSNVELESGSGTSDDPYRIA